MSSKCFVEEVEGNGGLMQKVRSTLDGQKQEGTKAKRGTRERLRGGKRCLSRALEELGIW